MSARTFKYKLGERVRIFQLDDDLAARNLIGHSGAITDQCLDVFPQPLCYEFHCETCGAKHFVHETEVLHADAPAPAPAVGPTVPASSTQPSL